MKIEITERIDIKKTIDIDFPYYYIHDLSGENDSSIIYGKIMERNEITIHETIDRYDDDNTTYLIEVDSRSDSYFKEKYESTEEEYEHTKKRMLKFLKDNNIL